MRDVVLDGTRRDRELPRDRRVAESPAHKFGDLEFAGRQHVRLPPAVDRPKLRRGLREGELLPGFPGGREAVRSEQQLRGRLYLSEVGKRYLVEPPPAPSRRMVAAAARTAVVGSRVTVSAASRASATPR